MSLYMYKGLNLSHLTSFLFSPIIGGDILEELS